MHIRVTDFFIYKWRYLLGYLFIAILLVIVVGVAVFSTPGELRSGEMVSTVKSAALSVESLDASMVVDLPYHVIQRITFIFFGVTTVTIKLASLILGTLTIIGVFLLARIWLRRNVAVLTTILAATSTQFLFLIQDGTPAIMYSFIFVWILLSGTFITRNYMFNTLWKVVAGILLASALYMPLGIYIVASVIITASLHPHIRHIIKHITRMRLILASSLAGVFITPLVYACVVRPEILLTLLGINLNNFSFTDHVIGTWNTFAGFLTPSTGYVLTPLYSLGFIILMAIGLWSVWRQRHTARSYVMLILSATLLILTFLDQSHASTLFIIAITLASYGIARLVSSWYQLFPRNPYARIAGLVPLTILILGIVYSGVIRYTHNYTYNPKVLSHYSDDLKLLDGTLSKYGEKTAITVVTTTDELPFYNVVAHYDKRFAASRTYTTTPIQIVTRAARAAGEPKGVVNTIVASSHTTESDRFYIYKSISK